MINGRIVSMSNKIKMPEYHQSAINTFLKCGKQWEFRYVLGIKTPPNAALTVGSSVDAAITSNLIAKKETGTDLPVDAVLEVYSKDFDVRKKDTEWGEENAGEQKDAGIECLKLHHKEIAPKIDPETVQENFVIETDAGYAIGGTLDITEKDGTIRDSKTSKEAYAEDAVTRALQPTMYDFAYQTIRKKESKRFVYDVMIKPKINKKSIRPAQIQIVEGKVTSADHEWLFNTINQMHKAVTSGVALPAPDGAWWCSKKWCGYWDMCKGKKS